MCPHCLSLPTITGVFALLQAVALLKYMQTFLNKSEFKYLFLAGLGAAGAVFLAVVGLTWAGVVAPWSGRQVKLDAAVKLRY